MSQVEDRVAFDRAGERLVVRLEGDLDQLTVRSIRVQAMAAIDAERTGPVTIDVAGVRFIDSSGLGLIVGLMKRAAAVGGITVVGASEGVLRAFSVTGLDRIIDIDG
jgi:anti-sigma B factor antagonist